MQAKSKMQSSSKKVSPEAVAPKPKQKNNTVGVNFQERLDNLKKEYDVCKNNKHIDRKIQDKQLAFIEGKITVYEQFKEYFK